MRVSYLDRFAAGTIVCLVARNKEFGWSTAAAATGLAFACTLARQNAMSWIFQKYMAYFQDGLMWLDMIEMSSNSKDSLT